VVVWGEDFTNRFLNLSLPSQLSVDNLSSFQYNDGSVYVIYTTLVDAEVIKGSRSFKDLSKIMPVDFKIIDGKLLEGSKYNTVVRCQIGAFSDESNQGCAFFILFPDLIFSNGSFRFMGRIAESGKRALAAPGLVLDEETLVPTLKDRFYSEHDNTLTIPARELSRLAVENLSQLSKTWFWHSPTFDNQSNQLIWDVPGEGFLSRAFLPQPFLVYPRKPIRDFHSSLDGGNFLNVTFSDPTDLYLVNASDDFVFVSSTHRPEPVSEKLSEPPSTFQIARNAASNATRYQRGFLKNTYRFHYTAISPSWEQAQDSSDRVVRSIQMFLWFRLIFWTIDWKRTVWRTRFALRNTRLGRVGARLYRRAQCRLARY